MWQVLYRYCHLGSTSFGCFWWIDFWQIDWQRFLSFIIMINFRMQVKNNLSIFDTVVSLQSLLTCLACQFCWWCCLLFTTRFVFWSWTLSLWSTFYKLSTSDTQLILQLFWKTLAYPRMIQGIYRWYSWFWIPMKKSLNKREKILIIYSCFERFTKHIHSCSQRFYFLFQSSILVKKDWFPASLIHNSLRWQPKSISHVFHLLHLILSRKNRNSSVKLS